MDDVDESNEIEANATTTAAARVSAEVPNFWKLDPKISFLQLEEMRK